jgi:membrane-associated phospholipid phosphatase
MFFLMIFISNKFYYKSIWLLLAILAGISRIYLSQHFFEDVIGGSLIGFVIAVFAYLLGTKYSIFKK